MKLTNKKGSIAIQKCGIHDATALFSKELYYATAHLIFLIPTPPIAFFDIRSLQSSHKEPFFNETCVSATSSYFFWRQILKSVIGIRFERQERQKTIPDLFQTVLHRKLYLSLPKTFSKHFDHRRPQTRPPQHREPFFEEHPDIQILFPNLSQRTSENVLCFSEFYMDLVSCMRDMIECLLVSTHRRCKPRSLRKSRHQYVNGLSNFEHSVFHHGPQMESQIFIVRRFG